VDPMLRAVMVACWQRDPSGRPTMSQLYMQLKSYHEQLDAAPDASTPTYEAFTGASASGTVAD